MPRILHTEERHQEVQWTWQGILRNRQHSDLIEGTDLGPMGWNKCCFLLFFFASGFWTMLTKTSTSTTAQARSTGAEITVSLDALQHTGRRCWLVVMSYEKTIVFKTLVGKWTIRRTFIELWSDSLSQVLWRVSDNQKYPKITQFNLLIQIGMSSIPRPVHADMAIVQKGMHYPSGVRLFLKSWKIYSGDAVLRTICCSPKTC